MPEKYEIIFQEICRGDASAYQYCCETLRWLHVMDDVLDNQAPKPAELLVQSFVRYLEMISTNDFWKGNAGRLMPVIRASAVAFLDSERWKVREDVRDKLAAEVLKSEYQNIFFEVAACVGGFPHQREMSERYRAYYFG